MLYVNMNVNKYNYKPALTNMTARGYDHKSKAKEDGWAKHFHATMEVICCFRTITEINDMFRTEL